MNLSQNLNETTEMYKQTQVLNDDSVAAVAIDHPCFHEWICFPWAKPSTIFVCKCCEFQMTESEFAKYTQLLNKEKENG